MKKELVYGSSFNRAIKHMNRYPCCFITAWRDSDVNGDKLSNNQKRKRNLQLASDIRASDLSYIKATGGFVENKETEEEVRVTEDTFCVINNKYKLDNFIKLCVSWCKKYEQDAILITIPKKESNSVINVIGRYYNSDGNVDIEFENVTIGTVDDYFTSMCGKDFVLSSTTYTKTQSYDVTTVAGRRLADFVFDSIYEN